MLLTVIHNEPSCRKCRDTAAVLAAVAAESGTCTVRSLSVSEAREHGFGVVLTPTVLIDDQVLCAGIVPSKAGLLRLVRGPNMDSPG